MSEAQLAERPKNGTGRNAGRFQKGNPGGPGRKPGETVGVAKTLREAVEQAARECHPQGLAGWLVERAQGALGDRQIFAGLVGKVIPIQVNQQVNGGVSISLNWLGGRNIGTIQAQPRVIDAQTIDLIEDSGPRRWIADANTDAGKALKPAGAAQSASSTQGSQASVIVDPAGSEGPSRGIGASDPHPP